MANFQRGCLDTIQVYYYGPEAFGLRSDRVERDNGWVRCSGTGIEEGYRHGARDIGEHLVCSIPLARAEWLRTSRMVELIPYKSVEIIYRIPASARKQASASRVLVPNMYCIRISPDALGTRTGLIHFFDPSPHHL